MHHTDSLSKTLQSPSLSAADSQQLVQLTCTTLERLRKNESFSFPWSKVSALQDKHQVNDAKLPRRRRVHSALRLALDKAPIQHRCKIFSC